MDKPDSDSAPQRTDVTSSDGVQKTVNTHFDSTVAYWDRVYEEDSLQGRIYRNRQVAVLTYIDAVGLAPGARVLEIGCGAGRLTMELAARGLRVEAVDASQAMVELTAQRAQNDGFSDLVNTAVADVHALPFAAGDFELVVAVGVLPWLHSPAAAMREMACVLADDGQLVLTADNGARLISFIDPREVLARTPLRGLYQRLRNRPEVATSHLDSPRRIERLVREGGLATIERRTVGFGPLSFMRRPLLDDRRGIRLDERLQRLADRNTLVIKWTGWHYVVRARKR